MKTKVFFQILGLMTLGGMTASCSQPKEERTTDNPHAYVTNEEHVKIITNLKELDPDRLYEMNYTADYKLDELIEAGVSNVEEFTQFVATHLFDVAPTGNLMPAFFSSGCSAYSAIATPSGDFLMGRNYDYCHVENGKEEPITALFVRCAPEGGKKSISMVDTYWLGFHKGFYKDGVTDLSMLIAAPYEMMDAVNEDGFAICVLHLDGKATKQDEPGKRPLWTNIMMRQLIDHCSTVEEALTMVKDYNVTMVTPATGSFHFYLCDATGDYAILEYSYENSGAVEATLPNIMKVFRGRDCDRYVTNFYIDPDLADHPTLGPLGKHGLWRYDTLRTTLTRCENRLTDAQAMDLLKAVSQNSNPDENTSHTQWSCLYNLTRRTVEISILQEYEKTYTFAIE